MNAVPNLLNAQRNTFAGCYFELQLKLSFKSRRYGVSLLPMVLALVMIFAGNVLLTTAQSETPPKPAPAPTATPAKKPGPGESTSPLSGQIKGRLVSTDGQLLTNANVMAQSLSGTPAAKPTRPDAEGRFVFDDLAPGSYILIGTAPGYIDQSWTNGNPTDWPRHLIGSNVRINMIRGGVITGLVTSAKGEPLVGVPVHATLMTGAASSVLSFIGGGSVAETDDRGVYRIYGLLPGQYTVNAGGNGPFGQFTASGFDNDVPTYYPSSPRDTAIPVSVRSGDETTGIDIKYKGMVGHSISGVVVGNIEASAATGAVTIMLAHAGKSSVLSLAIAGALDPRRAFSFNGVADGEYDLLASYQANATANALMVTKRVSVRGGDVGGLELRLASLGSLTGTITLDSIKPEDKCDKRGSQVMETILRLPHDDPKRTASQPLVAMYSGLGQLNDKGEFVLHNLEAAKYRVDIRLPSESWYVRTINLPAAAARPAQQTTPAAVAQPVAANPGVDVWQGLVTIKSGENLSGVSIMVGQDAAGLRGRVTPEGTLIREGTRVHLVPVERDQANNILRYSETIVKSDGSFALTNLAPGRYFILSRVEQLTEPDASPRPIAWDAAARIKLRREAEAATTIVELKPCQQVSDYALKGGG